MKVAILDDYQRAAQALECFAKLAPHEVQVFADTVKDEAKLAARLAEFEAVILIRERTRITAGLLARLPKLKLLVQTAKLGPHVELKACRERGVTVCDGSGGQTAPAELAWGLILASARNIVSESERLKQGLWQGSVGYSLAGRRIGLLGYGRIAQRLARYAAAFEMQVLVWGRDSTLVRAREAGLETADSVRALFCECDVVCALLRLNDETRSIVTFEHLYAMRPDALFVNISRAGLVEPGALERALRLGRPGHAALDVYDDEPIVGCVPPWLALPNVTATPHIGFVERGNYERYFGDAFDALNAYAAGKPIRTV